MIRRLLDSTEWTHKDIWKKETHLSYDLKANSSSYDNKQMICNHSNKNPQYTEIDFWYTWIEDPIMVMADAGPFNSFSNHVHCELPRIVPSLKRGSLWYLVSKRITWQILSALLANERHTQRTMLDICCIVPKRISNNVINLSHPTIDYPNSM